MEYRIHTHRQAASALWGDPEYSQHRYSHLPGRNAGRPGEKLLCWSHCEGKGGMIRLTRCNAKAAGTTVESLMKAYPSEWYVVGSQGVWVRFPSNIGYSESLETFHYCGLPAA